MHLFVVSFGPSNSLKNGAINKPFVSLCHLYPSNVFKCFYQIISPRVIGFRVWTQITLEPKESLANWWSLFIFVPQIHFNSQRRSRASDKSGFKGMKWCQGWNLAAFGVTHQQRAATADVFTLEIFDQTGQQLLQGTNGYQYYGVTTALGIRFPRNARSPQPLNMPLFGKKSNEFPVLRLETSTNFKNQTHATKTDTLCHCLVVHWSEWWDDVSVWLHKDTDVHNANRQVPVNVSVIWDTMIHSNFNFTFLI